MLTAEDHTPIAEALYTLDALLRMAFDAMGEADKQNKLAHKALNDVTSQVTRFKLLLADKEPDAPLDLSTRKPVVGGPLDGMSERLRANLIGTTTHVAPKVKGDDHA